MRDEMEGLRQKAYMAQVAYEGKQEAKRRKKNEEEAKRRKEEARIRKGLLEAAFDDELDELIKLLQQGADFADDVVRVMPCSHQLGQPRPESPERVASDRHTRWPGHSTPTVFTRRHRLVAIAQP